MALKHGKRLRVLDLEPRAGRAPRPVRPRELALVARPLEDPVAHRGGHVPRRGRRARHVLGRGGRLVLWLLRNTFDGRTGVARRLVRARFSSGVPSFESRFAPARPRLSSRELVLSCYATLSTGGRHFGQPFQLLPEIRRGGEAEVPHSGGRGNDAAGRRGRRRCRQGRRHRKRRVAFPGRGSRALLLLRS